MKKTTQSATLVAASLIIASISNTATKAGEFNGNGTVTYTVSTLEQMTAKSANSMALSHLRGVVLASDPTSPIHLSNQDCMGSTIPNETGAPLNGAGSCTGIDRDGDIWWIWYSNTSQSRDWGFIDGTGKFEGVKGNGTTSVLSASPNGRLAVTWQGKWTMKD